MTFTLHRRSGFRLFLVFLFAFSLWIGLFETRAQAADDSQFFPETGHTVSGKFLQYWKANGGLAAYGFPITDAQNETDPETGKTFLIQWFERNRFELHPENAGTKYEVLLGLLGKDLRREALAIDPAFQQANPLNLSDPEYSYFKETGHNLSAEFYTYWQENGGLGRFGYPISEAREEIDPETGKVFVMQWFERARFELHPENDPPYNVLLGLLGNQIKQPKSKVEFMWRAKAPRFAYSIATDKQDNLYVVDVPNARIQKYDNAGRFVSQFGSPGKGDGQFGTIGDVVTDSQGNIYVSEILGPGENTANLRVQKFDSTGKFLLKFGSQGEDPGQFQNPGFVAVDNQGNIFVGDIGNDTIQKFDKTGRFVVGWGGNGQNDGQINGLSGLVVDSAGSVFAIDQANNRVEKFDGSGKFLAKFGTRGSGDGQFNSPNSLATDSQNNLYIIDRGNGRIMKFDNGGKFLLAFGSSGSADGQLSDPSGLAIDSKGNIFVSDVLGESSAFLYKFRQR